MFTGIIEELGEVLGRDGARVRIAARTILDDAGTGDSIAVNGCCATLVDRSPPAANGPSGWWEADLSPETLDRTTLDGLGTGDPVNLERPVRLADRLGGHLVQGHTDRVGTVIEAAPDLVVAIPAELTRYVVEKGSITVDGVSLTVTRVGEPADSDEVTEPDDGDGVPAAADAVPGEVAVAVAVIPHTAAITTLGVRSPGDAVNIEVDVIAKYVESLLGGHLT